MPNFFDKVSSKINQFGQQHGINIPQGFPGQQAPSQGQYGNPNQQPFNAVPPPVPPHPQGDFRPALYPSPISGLPPGPGQRPPKVRQVHYHDKMRFLHPTGRPHEVLRDLGFTGVLGGKIVWTFGDTLMGNEQRSFICAVDSTCISHDLSKPMEVTDTKLWPNSDNVGNFIPCTPDEDRDGGLSCYSFGGTNILEVQPGVGLCYYLKIHRPGGNASVKGAGVAVVRLHPGDQPMAERAGEKMWTEEDCSWGDVGVQMDPRDGLVYVWGHGPTGNGELGARTFLCRVHKDRATDVNAYEYWLQDERRWVRERLTLNGGPGQIKCENRHAIFDWHVMGQSNPFWSNYFNCWLWLHGSGWAWSDVLCHTADRLEGPWQDHGMVASTKPDGHGDGMRYCATGHPEFDESGRTVLVTWTRNNVIWGVTVEFE